MTTHSPYNSQGWRSRQQKAAQRVAHQEKMAELRAERHRMFEEQTSGKPVADAVGPAPVPETPTEAPGTVTAPVEAPTPVEAPVEAAVASEETAAADESADVAPAAPKGRKKG